MPNVASITYSYPEPTAVKSYVAPQEKISANENTTIIKMVKAMSKPFLFSLSETSDILIIASTSFVIGFKNIFVDAPCVLCLAYDTTYDMSQVDCGLLGENIILSAWAKGIGSCCLGSAARWIKSSPSAQPYLDKMAFSEGYELLYCIALGYPDEAPAAKPRTLEMIRYMD